MVFIMGSILKCVLCGSNNNSSSSPRNWVRQGRFQDESIPGGYSPRSQRIDSELSVISSLPVSQFKKSEGQQQMMPINVDCAICLGEFEEGERLKLFPNCNHGFHVSCIDTWFRFHSTCPLCRSRVLVANQVCSVSFNTWLETLRMEDISPERDAYFQSHSL